MLAEMNKARRYLGGKFGMGNPVPDGVYAIPTATSKGPAFMRLEMAGGEGAGKENFNLYWDEALTQDWHVTPKPETQTESAFARAFRALEAARQLGDEPEVEVVSIDCGGDPTTLTILRSEYEAIGGTIAALAQDYGQNPEEIRFVQTHRMSQAEFEALPDWNG